MIVLGSDGQGDREHFRNVQAAGRVEDPYSRRDEHFTICGFRFIGNGIDVELMYDLRPEVPGKRSGDRGRVASLEFLRRSTKIAQIYARTGPSNGKSVQLMLRLGLIHVSTTESMITYVLRRPA